jgi:DNA-binding NtrC family response regulator
MKVDIPLLVSHFLIKAGRSPDITQLFSSDAVSFFQLYDWPGNVRELNNIVERAMILNANRIVSVERLKNYFSPTQSQVRKHGEATKTLKEAKNDFERSFIMQVLDECNGSISEAAKKLELQRSYLHQKINELGIGRTNDSSD